MKAEVRKDSQCHDVMVSNYASYKEGLDFKIFVLTSALVAVILHGICQSPHLNSALISNSFKAQWLPYIQIILTLSFLFTYSVFTNFVWFSQ
jgi:hypothetical protein